MLLIGMPLVIALALAGLVLPIPDAVRADERYATPLVLRFLS